MMERQSGSQISNLNNFLPRKKAQVSVSEVELLWIIIFWVCVYLLWLKVYFHNIRLAPLNDKSITP